MKRVALTALISLTLLSWNLALGARPESSPAPGVSFDIAAVPSWVKAVGLEPRTVDEDEGGISHLILDRQQNLASSSAYFHEARQITSERGVQNGASITASFDPSYEKLTFHSIQLWRGKVKTDRLDRSRIQLFQREKDMESFLYDGTYTAQCELEDIRVGDIIEFSYTIEGANPVKQGKYATVFYTNWGYPVHRLVTRVMYPSHRKLHFLIKNRELKPVVTTTDGATEWICDEKDILARRIDSEVPADYDPNGWVQVSEFESWREVVDWALPLYETNAPVSAELEAEIGKLAQMSKTDDRILAALRLVQEEIRYLGITSGVGSHRPTEASEVLRRRFGDCKGKARLLVTLLRRCEIDAAPALVSVSNRGTVSDRLPSPGSFDHVIVQVVDGDRTHWLDATRTNQRGPLSQVHVGEFQVALVIRPGTETLSPYSAPPGSRPRKKVTENYRVPAPRGSGELDVITEYWGQSAEKIRSFFQDNRREEVEKQYLQYYGRRFPRIRVQDPLVYQELPDENACKVKESYAIPDLWTRSEVEENYQLSIYPSDVDEAMGYVVSSQRQDPLAVNHPVNVTQEINAEMFSFWSIKTRKQSVTNTFFRFHDEASVNGRHVRLAYSYESLSDRVPLDALSKYNTDLVKVRDILGRNLTYSPPPGASTILQAVGMFNWPVAGLLGFVLTVTILVSGWYVYQSKLPAPLPPPLETNPSLSGIRGWLILVAVHHVARPIFLMVAWVWIAPTVFNLGVWRPLCEPGNPQFHPLSPPSLLFELFYLSVCLVFSILALVLFFLKRAAWRRCYVTLLLTLVGFCALDFLLAKLIPAEDASVFALVPALTAAAIWIPYCLVSKRVKATFRY